MAHSVSSFPHQSELQRHQLRSSDTHTASHSSVPRLPLAMGIGFAACTGVAAAYALYHYYYRNRSGAGHVNSSQLHTKKLGWLDKWYSQQLPAERRVFVEAVRVVGPQPSLLDIRMALSYLSFEHPTLSVYPSVDGEYFHSHLEHEAHSNQRFVTLPCAFLSSAAVTFTQRHSNSTIDAVIESELNRPFPIRSTGDNATDWHGYRVVLVAGKNVDDCAPNESNLPSASSFESEYELVLTMQHLTGDGLSGLILLRAILSKFAEQLNQSASKAPQQTYVKPLSDALPISKYKLLDEYVDVSTASWKDGFFSRLRGVVQSIRWYMFPQASKVVSTTRSFWNGPSALPEVSGQQTSGYLPLQLPSQTVKDLLRVCKARSVTLQGLLTAAGQFATANVALRAEPHLAFEPLCVSIGTPVSLRSQCQAFENSTGHPPLQDQIGNFIWAMYWPLDVIVGETSLFARAREYLLELRKRLPHAYLGIGQLSERGIRGQVEHTRSQTKNMRTCSVLVSNLGVLESTIPLDAVAPFEVKQVYFANAAHYFIAVFVNSVVSSSHGGLSIGVTFAKEVVSPTLAAEYIRELERILIQVSKLKDDDGDIIFHHH